MCPHIVCYGMVRPTDFDVTDHDDGTYTIDFNDDSGIDGVSTPKAIFSRMQWIVATQTDEDSALPSTIDTEAKTFTGTMSQLRKITSLMKDYEETEAGFGEDKQVYESRTVLNNLAGRVEPRVPR